MAYNNGRIGSFAAINSGVIEGCSVNVKLRVKVNGAGFVFGNSGVVRNSISLRSGGKGTTGFYKRNTGTIAACGYLASPRMRQADRTGNVTVQTGNPECFLPTGMPADRIYAKLGLQNLWKNVRGKKGFILEPDRFRNHADLFSERDRVISLHTPEDLRRMISAINAGDRKAAAANYRLEANLNMGGGKLEPIGLSEALPFTGSFDGNGKTVFNFTIVCDGLEYGGFFGYTKNAKIANLTVDYILKGKRGIVTGGLVGNAVGGGISNCHVRVGMTPGSCAGGFVGKNSGYIKNCFVCGSVAMPHSALPVVIPASAVLLAALVTTSVLVIRNLTGNVGYRPEIIDPNQRPAPDDDTPVDPLPTGTSRITVNMYQDIRVSYQTMVGEMGYVNPKRSTHDVVMRLCVTDAELTRMGYDLVACKVRTQAELDAPGYDPAESYTVLYQSGRLQIGYRLDDCKLSTLPNGEKLKLGDYTMYMLIDAYDPETNEKSVVNAKAEIGVHIVNE